MKPNLLFMSTSGFFFVDALALCPLGICTIS